MAVTRKRPNCQRANIMSFCSLYNVVSENHKVHNSPWGQGVFSQPKVYVVSCYGLFNHVYAFFLVKAIGCVKSMIKLNR